MSFKLGIGNVHHEKNIMTLVYRCYDNSHTTGSVLIRTTIPRFYVKQGLSTPTNLMGRVKTIREPCVFRLQLGIFGFSQKETGAYSVAMTTTYTVAFCSFVMYIACAKFEEYHLNICRVILDRMLCCFSGTTYDVITFLICIIQKREYL